MQVPLGEYPDERVEVGPKSGLSSQERRVDCRWTGSCRAQGVAALAELAGTRRDEEAIHEARKSLKKIRAVLSLVHDDLGSDYRAENHRLRSAAHRLAPLRDADATADSLQALHARYPTVVTLPVARVAGRGLRSRKRLARRHADTGINRAKNALRHCRRSTPRCLRQVGDLAAVQAGLTRGYRRARKVLSPLSIHSDASQFHAWRRRVKDHSYHVRLFAGLHASARARARTLERLETWLGEDHNQAILRATILAAPDRFGDARTTAVVLGCIVKHQAWLRARALKLGQRMFSARPREFRDRLTAWWESRS
jgi:CHAD domain-containing protein